MTHEHKARYGAGILACLVVIIAIFAVTAGAAPPTPNLYDTTVYAGNYNYDGTLALVQATETAFEFYNSFNQAFEYSVNNEYRQYGTLLLLTRRDIGNGNYVYTAHVGYCDTAAAAAQTKVESLPEELNGTGAKVRVSDPCQSVVEYRLRFTTLAKEQCGYENPTGAYMYWVGQGHTYTLRSDETVCYIYKGVGVGFTDNYQFGTVPADPAFQHWIDAGVAYDDGLGDPDAVDQAYDRGFQDGYTDGYVHGNTDGYSQGIINGSSTLEIGELISSIPEAAKGIINNAFGFEIFGIDVAGLLSALIVVGIIGFVVKWLMSR